MTRAIVGPGGGLVGPGGGLVGPSLALTAEVPAFVVTTSLPAPTTNALILEVPAFVITTSVPAPTAVHTALVPALSVTTSIPAPAVPLTASVPPFVVTLSVPAPAAGQLVSVPPFIVTTGFTLPYISAVALTGPIRLWIDRFEVGRMEWSMSTEEVLGGVGRATITVQDRNIDSEWEPAPHMDVLAVIRSSGWRLFHGETMQPSLSLPPGMPWRRWTIACRDYNGAMDERAVGAPPGGFWTRPSDTEPYRSLEPNAQSWATDKITVQQWVRHYLTPNAVVFDTGTYVEEYIPNSTLGDPDFILDLQDAMTTLRPALEQLAEIADVNIQFGVDADDRFHWQSVPSWVDGDLSALPPAPYAIVDMADNPDGITTIGHGGIDPGFDGQSMPDAIYVQGATTFVRTNAGTTVPGGSGWYPFIPDGSHRQAYLAEPGAWSVERRDAVAEAAMRRSRTPTLRGRLIVHGFTNAQGVRESRDGWRPWQRISISDPRLPASMKAIGQFVIQRVATTLLEGTDIRRYEIDFGDGPVGRMSQGGRKPAEPSGPLAQKPIVVWTADWQNFGPIGAGEIRTVVFTPRNGTGEPWGPPGIPMTFRVEARDTDGNVVAGQGTCSPASTTTDQDGKLRTTFTAGSTEGLAYQVFVETTVAPA